MKKYALVRVDKFCPRALERNYNLKCIGSLHCDKCDLKKKYGDTKEQLIRKVAQALLNKELEWYKKHFNIFPKGEIDKPFVRTLYECSLEQAKEIVEFLGVEK